MAPWQELLRELLLGPWTPGPQGCWQSRPGGSTARRHQNKRCFLTELRGAGGESVPAPLAAGRRMRQSGAGPGGGWAETPPGCHRWSWGLKDRSTHCPQSPESPPRAWPSRGQGTTALSARQADLPGAGPAHRVAARGVQGPGAEGGARSGWAGREGQGAPLRRGPDRSQVGGPVTVWRPRGKGEETGSLDAVGHPVLPSSAGRPGEEEDRRHQSGPGIPRPRPPSASASERPGRPLSASRVSTAACRAGAPQPP